MQRLPKPDVAGSNPDGRSKLPGEVAVGRRGPLVTSMAAVEESAGPDPDAAVVEPAAREVLADFDTRVEHLELALCSEP